MAYTPKILSPGYEDQVREMMGVKPSDLPDSAIQSDQIVGIAETMVIRRVPGYANLKDPGDLLYLQRAVLSYICYLLAPSMPNRVKTSVQTIDVTWQIQRVDWAAKEQDFYQDFEDAIGQIQDPNAFIIPTVVNVMGIVKGPSGQNNNG